MTDDEKAQTFEGCLPIGLVGEQLQLVCAESNRLFSNELPIVEWNSVPNAKAFQLEGIDMIGFGCSNNMLVKREAKACCHDTGNFFIETVSSPQSPGWLHNSRADYLDYFRLVAGTLVSFHLPTLREYVLAEGPDYWTARWRPAYKTLNDQGMPIYQSSGLAIRVWELEQFEGTWIRTQDIQPLITPEMTTEIKIRVAAIAARRNRKHVH